jgi:hypothetical protein
VESRTLEMEIRKQNISTARTAQTSDALQEELRSNSNTKWRTECVILLQLIIIPKVILRLQTCLKVLLSWRLLLERSFSKKVFVFLLFFLSFKLDIKKNYKTNRPVLVSCYVSAKCRRHKNTLLLDVCTLIMRKQ